MKAQTFNENKLPGPNAQEEAQAQAQAAQAQAQAQAQCEADAKCLVYFEDLARSYRTHGMVPERARAFRAFCTRLRLGDLLEL